MSILIFVFSLSLSQYRCLCRFLYICLCLNISTIELTWLFWKCADVTGKLNSRLWTSGAFPAKSNIRFFRIFRAQQFNLQSWLDLILTLEFWKMRNISRLVCWRRTKDADQLALEYKGTQLQFGKCPLMNIFTWSTLQIRKPDFSTPIVSFCTLAFSS